MTAAITAWAIKAPDMLGAWIIHLTVWCSILVGLLILNQSISGMIALAYLICGILVAIEGIEGVKMRIEEEIESTAAKGA